VRLAALKTVAAFVALLTVVACQSSHPATDRRPSGSPSAPVSSSSAPTQVLSYPKYPMRDAVMNSRFVATYGIDHGVLTIEPPPASPPAISGREAMNRFRKFGLVYVSPTLTAYGSVTLVPRPLAMVRITNKPAWVIAYSGPPVPLGCPYMASGRNRHRVPLSLHLAIVPTDGSQGAEFASAGRNSCGWVTPTLANWA
jgi:hypothetical protein